MYGALCGAVHTIDKPRPHDAYTLSSTVQTYHDYSASSSNHHLSPVVVVKEFFGAIPGGLRCVDEGVLDAMNLVYCSLASLHMFGCRD